jgi:hypothetical protein
LPAIPNLSARDHPRLTPAAAPVQPAKQTRPSVSRARRIRTHGWIGGLWKWAREGTAPEVYQ